MTPLDASSVLSRGTVSRWVARPEIGLVIIIAIMVGTFSATAPGFLSPFNTFAVARELSVAIVLGYAMMVVLSVGGMNLAVGSIGVCAAMATAGMQASGVPMPVSVILGLACGAVLGAVNGIVVVRTGLNSFLVTLATMSIYFGIMLLLSGAEAIRSLDPNFVAFGRARIYGAVPVMFVVSVVLGLILAYFYRGTDIGRQMLFTGSNPKAAELSGVPVVRAVVVAHTLSGLLAGLAGIILTARTGAGIPSLAGQIGRDWLLPAFIAPVLGGSALSGGSVAILGTLLGATLVGVLGSGLRMVNIGDFWIELFLGIILLFAVLADRLRSLWSPTSGAAP
jgi:ribose transport system permease protein